MDKTIGALETIHDVLYTTPITGNTTVATSNGIDAMLVTTVAAVHSVKTELDLFTDSAVAGNGIGKNVTDTPAGTDALRGAVDKTIVALGEIHDELNTTVIAGNSTVASGAGIKGMLDNTFTAVHRAPQTRAFNYG